MRGRRLANVLITAVLATGCVSRQIRNEHDRCDPTHTNLDRTIKCLRDIIERYKNETNDRSLISIESEYEQLIWDKAERTNSIEGYETYLKETKSGNYRTRAEEKILDIQDDQLWEANSAN